MRSVLFLACANVADAVELGLGERDRFGVGTPDVERVEIVSCASLCLGACAWSNKTASLSYSNRGLREDTEFRHETPRVGTMPVT